MAAFKYAFAGLQTLFKETAHAKIHFAATIVVLSAGFYFQIETNEWLFITLAISAVWMAEAFNSALESAVDLAHPEKHPIAKKAKDLAAAAVLISAIGALILGILIFIPKILS